MNLPLETAYRPRRAMVLAAGLGIRMQPLTTRIPKPLVPVGGKPLIDHVLDRLVDAEVELAVVNVHHLAEQIIRHVERRQRPHVVVSDERGQILGTGGGVVQAMAQLGGAPFFHVNSDTIWTEGPRPNFAFPGAWLYSDGRAVVHLVDISPTDEPQKPDSGVVHHVAFASRGFHGMKQRLQSKGVAFESREVPGGDLWQIFITDPNGVMIELNYETTKEK